jgi:hypothetical protein
MLRTLGIAALTLALVATATASHTPSETSIETSGTVGDGDYRYYIAQDKVAYAEEYMREEVDGEFVQKPIYTNISVDQFAAMKATDFASTAAEEAIRAELGAQNMTHIGFGTTSHDEHHFALRVAYREPADHGNETYIDQPPFSYDRLRAVAPDNVQVTVSFADQTRTVDVPVVVTRQQPERAVGGDTGTADQAGGSKTGDEWRLDVTQSNVSCWSGEDAEELSNIEFDDSTDEGGDRAVTFTGTIETSNPCQKIAGTGVEWDGDTYTLNIKTEQTGEICVDCVGAVRYTATFGSELDPYRLKVEHNGEHVQDIDFPGYEPDPSDQSQGPLATIMGWLKGLF